VITAGACSDVILLVIKVLLLLLLLVEPLLVELFAVRPLFAIFVIQQRRPAPSSVSHVLNTDRHI
jgi:hypothetical protein